MKYSSDKQIHVLVRKLVRDDWEFVRGGKHGRLRSPEGLAILTVPGSPSDSRAFLNFRQDVRRVLSFLTCSACSHSRSMATFDPLDMRSDG